jgi:uncharacterized protein (DUF4415 family)
MKAEYTPGKGRLPLSRKKVRITIRIDRDIVDWFRSKADEQGGGNYQSMLNAALREYIERQEQPLEEIIRRVVREEMRASR